MAYVNYEQSICKHQKGKTLNVFTDWGKIYKWVEYECLSCGKRLKKEPND